MSQAELLRDHMWRIAQGVADPQAYAKSVLKEHGVDFDAEQARLNDNQERTNAQRDRLGLDCSGDD